MKIILTGFNTRAIACSGVTAGYEVMSVDCFGDLDHRLLCPVFVSDQDYPDSLLEKSKSIFQKESASGVVYTSPLENYPHLIRELEDKDILVMGNNSRVLKEISDLKSVSAELKKKGFKVPQIYDRRNIPSVNCVKKPRRTGGGRRIGFYKNGEDIPPDFILQQYIEGTSGSFVFLADGKYSKILAISEQLIGLNEFNAQNFEFVGNILPLEVRAKGKREIIYREVQAMGDFLTKRYGLMGVNGVDFIYDGDNVWFIELNPRYTASMELIELSSNISIVDKHIKSFFKGVRSIGSMDLKPFFLQNNFYGKAVIYSNRRAVVKRPAMPLRKWVEMLYELGIRDIPFPFEKIEKGKPVATVLASGKSRNECFLKLEKMSKKAIELLLN